MSKPLSIIPTYLRRPQDLDVFVTCLRTLRETAGDRCDVLVVDDGSPDLELARALRTQCDLYDAELCPKEENEGFSRTVNVGLRRALDEGRDAILVNSDIEFGLTTDWLGLMLRQTRDDGDGLASVVGALLIYPNGLIQHGGIFFSLLTREFGHRFHYGPGDLPEAQVATVCPVTAALQFIRHECLAEVGVYDEEGFRLGWEDVDYNVRTWLSGRQCVYQPGIRAIHHEQFTRGQVNEKIERWTHESWMRFAAKWSDQSFAEFVPDLLNIGGSE